MNVKRLVTGESITHDTAVQTPSPPGPIWWPTFWPPSATSMAGSAAGRLRPWHLQQKDCRYRLAGESGVDQPKWTATVRFENPDGSLVMQESCQGTHRECWI